MQKKYYLIDLLLKKTMPSCKWFNLSSTIRHEVKILVEAFSEKDAMQIAVNKEVWSGWNVEGYKILNDKMESENGHYIFTQKTIVEFKQYNQNNEAN